MVVEINWYAEQVMGVDHAHHGRDEGIPGLFNLPAIKDYWKTNKCLHYSLIDKFLDISKYIHFVSNTTLQPQL